MFYFWKKRTCFFQTRIFCMVEILWQRPGESIEVTLNPDPDFGRKLNGSMDILAFRWGARGTDCLRYWIYNSMFRCTCQARIGTATSTMSTHADTRKSYELQQILEYMRTPMRTNSGNPCRFWSLHDMHRSFND